MREQIDNIGFVTLNAADQEKITLEHSNFAGRYFSVPVELVQEIFISNLYPG